MKLNIGNKVNLIIISTILLVGGGSLLLSVWELNKESKIAIDNYSLAVMNEKKSQIKDLVNSAYTIAKKRVDAANNKEKIRNEFGTHVKSVTDQAMSVFESTYENTSIEDMEKRKESAIKIIDKMRWGSDKKGYFWIQDTGYRIQKGIWCSTQLNRL